MLGKTFFPTHFRPFFAPPTAFLHRFFYRDRLADGYVGGAGLIFAGGAVLKCQNRTEPSNASIEQNLVHHRQNNF